MKINLKNKYDKYLPVKQHLFLYQWDIYFESDTRHSQIVLVVSQFHLEGGYDTQPQISEENGIKVTNK